MNTEKGWPTMISSDQTDYRHAIKRIGLAAPRELYAMITTGCNLHCRHCWPRAVSEAEATSITPSAFHALVDNFIRLGTRRICITGGEPLTHPDCDDMLAYAIRQKELERICLQTNGTQFTADRIARINTWPREKIQLQVSMEGARPETHDALRGKGSFKQALTGLKRLSDIGWGVNVTVAFTETYATIEDLPDLLSLVEQLGIKKLVSGCLVTKGRARQHSDLAPPQPSQYASLLDLYHRDTDFRERYDRLGNFAAIEWFKGRSYPRDDNCRCMQTPCVTSTGSLYPCQMLPLERWRIDRVFERSFGDLIAEIIKRWGDIPGVYQRCSDLLATCHACSGNEHCGGGCLGRVADIEGHGVMVEDRCDLRQTIYSWKAKQ